MANKKKKKQSNSYWMKYGGTSRKMYGTGGDWTGGRDSMYTMSAGRPMVHELTGLPISPMSPQYVEGEQWARNSDGAPKKEERN